MIKKTKKPMFAVKDDELLMSQKLIIMDEMSGKNKTDQKRFKDLTSKHTFSLRAPYDRGGKKLTLSREETAGFNAGVKAALNVIYLYVNPCPESNKIIRKIKALRK